MYDLYEVVTHDLLSSDLRWILCMVILQTSTGSVFRMYWELNMFFIWQGAARYLEYISKGKEWGTTLF